MNLGKKRVSAWGSVLRGMVFVAVVLYGLPVDQARAQQCTDDSQCLAPNACVSSECAFGTCLLVPIVGACDDGNLCTVDECNPATGACSNTPVDCGAPPTRCGGGSICDQSNGQCIFQPVPVCNDGNACTSDSCDNASGCVFQPISCIDDGNACTAESCDEQAGCVVTAVSCDDGNPCTIDSCDPSSGCLHVLAPPGTECRESAGLCDLPEFCTGDSTECPGDGFALAATVCRESAGVCDVAETCSGDSAACPGDAFAPNTTECRPSAGICDVAETCSGSSATCAPDAFAPATTQCSESTGVCDVAEMCSGDSATCSADQVAAAVDHYKCYKAHASGPFHRREVTLTDQFGITQTQVRRPSMMCNPVDKDGEGIVAPSAHLTCYDTREFGQWFRWRKVLVENQFGAQTLRVRKPNLLCVPSEKDAEACTNEIDHFKCYGAHRAIFTPRFESKEVTLTDQFETKRTRVTRPVSMCNPVDKNGEGVLDPTTHLTCFDIRDASRPSQPRFEPRHVRMRNQFGEESLTVTRPDTLCVPSAKTELP